MLYKMDKRIVIYCRVSSVQEGRQSYDRQVAELTEYANQHNYQLVKVFSEKVSGAKCNSQRPVLMEMIDFVKNNNIQKVVCLEISRLGRNTLECLQCINILTENSVSLLIVNNGLETLNDKREVNPVTQLILTIMLELGALERKLIRERVESGYNHYRKNGGVVGRRQGYKKPIQDMKEEYKEEIKMLEKGYSYTHISKITNTNKNTLTKLKRLFIIE